MQPSSGRGLRAHVEQVARTHIQLLLQAWLQQAKCSDGLRCTTYMRTHYVLHTATLRSWLGVASASTYNYVARQVELRS